MNEIAITVARTSESHQQRECLTDQTDAVFSLPLSMPLVLDLDGTLIAGDLLYKSFVSILRRNPLIVFRCAAWLLHGRAALKRQLALRSRIDWDRLQLRQDVLALAIRENTAGRAIVLATAADAVLAERRQASVSSIRCSRRTASEISRVLQKRTCCAECFLPGSSMRATAKPISRYGPTPAALSSSTRADLSPKRRARWGGRYWNCRAALDRSGHRA